MGCQNSKLVNPDILAIPPKLRPLLWRKVEEIRRRRRRSTASSTLSKKELLPDGTGGHEESEPLRENENERLPSPDGSMSSSGSQPNGAQENVSEEKKDQAEETESKEDDKEEEKQKDVKKEEEEEEEEEEEQQQQQQQEQEKEEDDDDDEEGEERNIYAGSPSFRVYIEPLEDKKEHDDEEGNDDSKDENVNDTLKKSSRVSSVDSMVLEDSNEEQETKIRTKSGKSRTRITRAICRGPVAVKHLLNVTSCYHPSNERASLITKKTDP